MRDAEYDWTQHVHDSVRDLEGIRKTIDRLEGELRDLVGDVKNLTHRRFDDDEADYTIRTASQQLHDTVSTGVRRIEGELTDGIREMQDLSRIIDFYRR